ncbi:YebG family protein [Thalassotalea maritima]|uniref:YebG family protein n=1 Tax=Thalassotalea maritima TaxID=3242416 RepID=UPI003528708A
MAVESRFVVVRDGVEVETFMDKKSADEYDKMLDMADSLSELLEQSPLKLDDQVVEELSVFLAKHRDDVLISLQAKKAKPAITKKVATSKAVSSKVAEQEAEGKETSPAKAKKTKAAK